MFGKIWNDTVNRVKTTAVEVQNQVNQKAAKAREVILQYGKKPTIEQLEHQLLAQIVNLETAHDIEELCARWLKDIKQSPDFQCTRYLSSKSNQLKNNSQPIHNTSKSDHIGSHPSQNESNNQSITKKPLAIHRWETFNTNLITKTDALLLQHHLFPDSSQPENSDQSPEATVSDFSPQTSPSVQNLELSPTSPSSPQGITSLMDLMVGFTITGLTFKEIILRSDLLEKLILRIFRDFKLVKLIAGPLENSENSASSHSRKLLLKIFNELLMGGDKLHRQILTLLMTMDPEWKGHVECMAKLISLIKWDWISERLYDLRSQMVHDMKHFYDVLEHWSSPELDSVKFNNSYTSLDSNGLIKHNIRIMTSRRLIQLHQLLSANLHQASERRKHQAKAVKIKLKTLTNKIIEKESQYNESLNLAVARQVQFQEEGEQKSKDFDEKINSFSKDYDSFDERLSHLLKTQEDLVYQLKAVEDEIVEINLERSNYLSSVHKYQQQQQEQNKLYTSKISLEKAEEFNNKKKQVDCQNILGLTNEANNSLFSKLLNNAEELEDVSKNFQQPTAKLLAKHLEYEKERLLYQNQLILNSNPDEFIEKPQQTTAPEDQHPSNDKTDQNVEYFSGLRTQEQLDSSWVEFRSFALSCEKIFTLPAQEVSPTSTTPIKLSSKNLLKKPMWTNEEDVDNQSDTESSITHELNTNDESLKEQESYEFMTKLSGLENLYFTLKEHISALNKIHGEDESKVQVPDDELMINQTLANIKHDPPIHTSDILDEEEIEEDLDMDEFLEKYINDGTAAALKHQF